MFLGFHHPSGEVHIEDSGEWAACPGTHWVWCYCKFNTDVCRGVSVEYVGQDNESKQCVVGDVPNIFESDESDHDGPYDGVEMGC